MREYRDYLVRQLIDYIIAENNKGINYSEIRKLLIAAFSQQEDVVDEALKYFYEE